MEAALTRSFLVSLLLACATAGAQDVPGAIEGRVTVNGGGQPKPLVVYVKGPGPTPPGNVSAEVEQLNQQFQPRGIVVIAGNTVDFPNKDPFFHNVFSVDPGSEFSLGKYRRGESGSYTFYEPGIAHVYCNEHANMALEVLVLENTWYAEVDGEGRFRIEGVAPGTHTLAVWSWDLEETRELKVTVPAAGAAQVEFLDVRRERPQPHTRSDGSVYRNYP